MKIPIRFLPCVLLLFSCQGSDAPNGTSSGSILSAAEQGDLQQLNHYLMGQQLVNLRDACWFTPLMKAALNGHLEAVKKLVEKGAEIDLMDKGGYTAMMLAASNNFHDIVDYLLQQGADVNHTEHTHGWTALIWAAKRGHVETVTILLKHQPNLEIQDGAEKTALDHAQEMQFEEVIALLE